jgi:hypothetical protein
LYTFICKEVSFLEELPRTDALNAVRAQQLLAEIATLRQRGRRPAGLWPPLVVFGIVAAAGAPLIAVRAVPVSVWWLIAAPAAFAAVSVVSARQARRRGFQRPGWRLAALGAVSFAAAWLACLVIARAARWPAGLGWTVAVAAGYLAWSWFARSRPAAIVAVALAAVGVTLALAAAPAWGVQLGVGIAMVTGGLVLRLGPEA